MRKIIAAVDFSAVTEKVIEKAVEFAKKFGAKLYIVHIEPPEFNETDINVSSQNIGSGASGLGISDTTQPALTRFKDNGQTAKTRLDQIRKKLVDDGVEGEHILLDGNVEKGILNEARELDADMIVIGSHKHSTFYRLFFGEIGPTLVAKSPCPVLVVPE
jgi:nucleotide-binding universal stress UspA family protein